MGMELADIVFDCAHPATVARFWADALDRYDVAPYDTAELARLAAMGIDDPLDDPTVLVESAGGGPRLWFKRVAKPKVGKNRVHLDIRVDDRPAAARRLVAMGATSLPDQPNPDSTVMRDPEGNEFCLVDQPRPTRARADQRYSPR